MSTLDNGEALQNNPWGVFWAEFWKQADEISKHQGAVLVNWNKWFADFGIAPLKNSQDILQGWFCPTVKTVINGMNSSDRGLENEVVRDIASYGSQLGTLADCLQVLINKAQLTADGLDDDEQRALEKFTKLAAKIRDAKIAKGLKPTLPIRPAKERENARPMPA